MRVKRGVAARAKHKKILKAAEGMQHNRTRSFRLAKQGVIRALSTPTAIAETRSAIYAAYGLPESMQPLDKKAQLTANL